MRRAGRGRRAVRGAACRGGQPGQHGQAERERLAGPGLRPAEHVPAGQRVRQRPGLDGERRVDAAPGQRADQRCGQPQVAERDVLRRGLGQRRGQRPVQLGPLLPGRTRGARWPGRPPRPGGPGGTPRGMTVRQGISIHASWAASRRTHPGQRRKPGAHQEEKTAHTRDRAGCSPAGVAARSAALCLNPISGAGVPGLARILLVRAGRG